MSFLSHEVDKLLFASQTIKALSVSEFGADVTFPEYVDSLVHIPYTLRAFSPLLNHSISAGCSRPEGCGIFV